MNIIVIGEPCVDVIHKSDGSKVNSYGGILYSLISLAVLAGKEDVIIPLMNLGEDEYSNITGILSKYPNIKTHGINKVKHPTRKVNLYYDFYNSDKSARIEKSTEPTYTLDYSYCENYLRSADAALINMISGIDISVDTLKKIRKNFGGFIHIDIHNIVMKTLEDGRRQHNPIDNWYEWCTNSDTVQMNEFEIATLSSAKLKEYQIAEQVLFSNNYDVKGMIVTRGKHGITGFTRTEKIYGNERFSDIDRLDVASIENSHFMDSTGCGDVFASAFTIDYLRSRDFHKSMHFANRIASYNSSLEGIDELHKLK